MKYINKYLKKETLFLLKYEAYLAASCYPVTETVSLHKTQKHTVPQGTVGLGWQ